MIDMHFDLLSIIYQCYLRMDFTYLDNVQKYISLDNVILSIEGCDYINNLEELEELYNLGLRNILLVWKNPNKYGSGNKGEIGLTELGREFLKKAIDLGICIDVSHMNKETFYDTIEVLKEQKKLGKEVRVIASHSNAYKICPNQRNLDDEQLLALKELDAVIGVVSYSDFVLSTRASEEQLKEYYYKHIEHLKNLIGIEHVGVASDDMIFEKVLFGKDYGPQVFEYATIKDEISCLLKEKLSEEEIEKILYKNINNLLWEEEK